MIFCALLSGLALANGQNTHVWITLQAAEQVQDPTLRALLADNQNALINGSMFPDGGYAVNHPYGEAGHWEGVQDPFRDWLRENQDPQDVPELVAFYMGMASHGMADQSFDAFYFSESRVRDADYGWAENESFDEASDVIWAALNGGSPVPVREVPAQMPGIYEGVGIQVDPETLDDGQKLVISALELVALLGTNEAKVAEYQALFPWGGANLEQPLPGAPADEARIVAAYLDSLWVDLRDGDQPLAVVATVPAAGSYGWPTDAADVGSRMGLVFSKAMEQDQVLPDNIVLLSQDGDVIAVSTDMFYGSGSHVLHVVPQENLALDTDYSLSLVAGVQAQDGRSLPQDFSFSFSTRAPPADTQDTGAEERGCGGCGGGGGGWVVLGMLALLTRRGNGSEH
ncbi:MAG: hypothetical protein ACI9VR_000764 [Cognaticolwellia sp.]